MKITELLSTERMNLDMKSVTKDEVIREIAHMFFATGVVSDLAGFISDIKAREELGSTALDEGIAIPHAKTGYTKQIALAFGRSKKGVDYESLDGKASDVFFMIAAPEDSQSEYMELLERLTEMLLDEGFKGKLLTLEKKEEILKLIDIKENEDIK